MGDEDEVLLLGSYLSRLRNACATTAGQIIAALNLTCPHRITSIPPDKQVRIDFEHQRCPACKQMFIPQAKYLSTLWRLMAFPYLYAKGLG